MEEENIKSSYYEMTYLDDYNMKHYAKVYDKNEVDYIKDRYIVSKCNLVKEEN